MLDPTRSSITFFLSVEVAGVEPRSPKVVEVTDGVPQSPQAVRKNTPR